MILRKQHYGVSFIIAAVVFGTLAVFAGDTRDASAGAPRLSAALTPRSAQMNTGTSATFNVVGVYTDESGKSTNVMPATISWLPNGATVVSYSKNTVVIKAGNVGKAGNLGVKITYAGLSASADAPLKIVAPATPAPATPQPTAAPATVAPATPQPTATPNSSSPGPLSPADVARLEALTSIFRPVSPTLSVPKVSVTVLGCLEQNLGARFAGVSSGGSQPTAEDKEAAAACFSDADPMPAVLAPVSPSEVSGLSAAPETVTITEVKKVVDTASDGRKFESLVLSGRGTANTSVYLYFFSDPLVIRVPVNSSGAWTHSLAAALPVGSHEVYAVAASAPDAFVRSMSYPVTIAAVSSDVATASKFPQLTTTQMLLAGGSVVMLILAIVMFSAIIRAHRRRKRLSAGPFGTPNPMTGATVMPTASELLAAAPVAPAPQVSVESIINTPIPKSTTGSTYLPGGTVPKEYQDDPQPPAGTFTPPKP